MSGPLPLLSALLCDERACARLYICAMPHLLIFDVSGGELLVIMLFVLLFFGSKGIPGIARTLGRGMRQLRDASAEVQREIEKGAEEVKSGYDQQRAAFRLDQPENARPQEAAPPEAEATPSAPEPAPPAAPADPV